jgi:hypothetical protein
VVGDVGNAQVNYSLDQQMLSCGPESTYESFSPGHSKSEKNKEKVGFEENSFIQPEVCLLFLGILK